MTSDKLNSNQKLLPPGQIIENDYEIIKIRTTQFGDREQLITSYLVRERHGKEDSLFVLELINDANLPAELRAEDFFLQQISSIEKLSSHVQIPKLRTYFRDDNGYYVVYEYVPGELLATILRRRSLNESEVVNLLQDVARIYDLAIKNNIVNFNLLPCNILKNRTNQRYVLGNLRELFFSQQTIVPLSEEEQKYLFQSQLQSLALILIQSGIGNNRLREANEGTIPVDWRKRIKLSPRLQNILAKMIAIEKSDRYNSFQEVIDDCQPLLKIDRVVGERYRLIRYLGEKNGVRTYLARNIRVQKPNSVLLIVKQTVLAHSRQDSIQIKARLRREVVKHQQLSPIDGIDFVLEKSEREELYYIRNYVEGISLSKKLNQQKLFPPKKAIRLLKKILERLNLIHQQNLIHRNLKPSNIIISDDERSVFLVDMGILQAVDETGIDYARGLSIRQPPEQIVGRPTPSSDLYALGIIAIEMLTGLSIQEISFDPFFEQQTWRDRLEADSSLIPIIERMICTDVEKRYQSTAEVLRDLARLPNYRDGTAFRLSRKIPLISLINKNRNPLIAIAITGIIISVAEFLFPFIRPQYYTYRGHRQLTAQPTAALDSFERALGLQHKLTKAWVGKGKALLALGSPTSALKAYETATSISPNNAAAWEGKGDVFSSLGNLDRAITTYNKALELKPEDTATEAKQGKTLYQLARYEEAFSIQEQAIAQTANTNIQLLSDAGRSALALGKNNQALSILTRVESTAPLKPYLWQDKVTALLNLNRSQEALLSANLVIESYDRALDRQPEVELWLGKGAFLAQLQRYEKALEAYEEAIAITPNSDVAWLGVSQVFLALQEYNNALKAIEKTLEIQPNSFRAWQTLGLILQEQQELDKALAAYDRAIEINPDFFPAWRNRAVILIARNNYSEGIKSLQKALALAPQDVESWLQLSDAHQSAEQIQAALDAVDKAIVLQPRNSDFWLKKGSLWEEEQEYTKACNIYRQAIKIAPSLKITGAMERVGCSFE